MDRLRGLELFAKAVDLGGLSRAALALGMSASAATQHIQTLEREFGVRLLDRTTRRIALTEAGALVLDNARRALEAVEEARAAAASTQHEPRGRLRVSVPVSYASRRLGDAIAGFLAAYPGVVLDIVADDRRVDLVAEGFDVVLRVGVLADSTLISTRLAPSPLIVCCAPSFVTKHGTPGRPEDLARLPCLEYSLRNQSGSWTLHCGEQTVAVRVEGSLQANNGELLRSAAMAGLGIILAPEFLVDADLQSGHLIRVLPDWRGPDAWIYALRPAGRYLPAKVRSFIDFIRDHLRSPSGS